MAVPGWSPLAAAATALALAALCSLRCHTAEASLQGLYVLTAGHGQLQLVDPSTGAATAVGAPLSSSGFVLEDCVPTAIDTTGKWLYTLARNRTGTSTTPTGQSQAPLTLVAVQLADGVIHRSTYPLPPQGFDSAAAACDHTIASDGNGWHAYVTAIVTTKRASRSAPRRVGSARVLAPTSSSQPPSARLRTVVFTLVDWPGTPNPLPSVVLDVPVAGLGLGGGVVVPSSTIDDIGVLWTSLEHGAAGAVLRERNRTTVDRVARAPFETTLSGLQAGYGQVFLLLAPSPSPAGAAGSVVASFSTGDAHPSVRTHPAFGNTSLPFATAMSGSATALLTDKRALVLATVGGRLAVLGLDGNGTAALSPPSLSARAAGMSYEPFVFR